MGNRSFALFNLVLIVAILSSATVAFAAVETTTATSTTNVEECIKLYQTQKNLTYDEAKRVCSAETTTSAPVAAVPVQAVTTTTTTTSRIEECAKSYQSKFNITAEEAKARCEKELAAATAVATTISQVEPTKPAPSAISVAERCSSIKERIIAITQKIAAAPEAAEQLTRELESARQEYVSCLKEAAIPSVAAVAVTPAVYKIEDRCEAIRQKMETVRQEIERATTETVPTAAPALDIEACVNATLAKGDAVTGGVAAFELGAGGKGEATLDSSKYIIEVVAIGTVDNVAAATLKINGETYQLKSGASLKLPDGASVFTEGIRFDQTTGQGSLSFKIQAPARKITAEEARKHCELAAREQVVKAITPTEALKSDFESLRASYEMCQRAAKEAAARAEVKIEAVTTFVPSCEEFRLAKEVFAKMKEKLERVKALVAKGEGGYTKVDVEILERDLSYMQSRLEFMEKACVEKKVVERSPCARLGEFELQHRHYLEALSKATGKEAAELKVKADAIATEIVTVKKRCAATKLTQENVTSLIDLEKAYSAKVAAVTEVTSSEQLIAELRSVEDEKRKLLEEFVRRAKELEAKKLTIIKKLSIKPGEVRVEDIRATETADVEVEVEGEEVDIKVKERELELVAGNVSAKTETEFEIVNGTLVATKSKTQVKVTPADVKEKLRAEIKEMRLEDKPGEVARYVAKTERSGRLLFFIPVTFAVDGEVNAATGNIIAERKPFWSFLVWGG